MRTARTSHYGQIANGKGSLMGVEAKYHYCRRCRARADDTDTFWISGEPFCWPCGPEVYEQKKVGWKKALTETAPPRPENGGDERLA